MRSSFPSNSSLAAAAAEAAAASSVGVDGIIEAAGTLAVTDEEEVDADVAGVAELPGRRSSAPLVESQLDGSRAAKMAEMEAQIAALQGDNNALVEAMVELTKKCSPCARRIATRSGRIRPRARRCAARSWRRWTWRC